MSVPQGDLHFFSYDVTAVVGAFGLGYFVFVGVLVPRLVATLHARAWLGGAAQPTRVAHSGRISRVAATDLLGAATVVATSETFLALVQFGLLVLVVYQVGAHRLGVAHPGVPTSPPALGVAPHFGVYTQVGTNLVTTWGHRREDLFFRPGAAALLGVTRGVLARLVRVPSPGVLPRLMATVKDSARGLSHV